MADVNKLFDRMATIGADFLADAIKRLAMAEEQVELFAANEAQLHKQIVAKTNENERMRARIAALEQQVAKLKERPEDPPAPVMAVVS